MKRKICTLLSLLLILNVIFTPAWAEERILTRDQIPQLGEENAVVQAMQKLGFLRGTENGLELERDVTRAETVAFISRLYPGDISPVSDSKTIFADMKNHWANAEVNLAASLGWVHGTQEGFFEPERTVTGKEFVKILLSALGYSDMTIENAYETGKKTGLLDNNFTKTVVYENLPLNRGDVVRICMSALLSKTAGGNMLYEDLATSHRYTKEDFNILYANSEHVVGFADRLNAQMPTDQNYMFSPFSIRTAMAMAANGAAGNTQSEILKALDISDLNTFNQQTADRMKCYGAADDLKIEVANSLWLNTDRTPSGAKFTENFENAIGNFYGGTSKEVTDANAVPVINNWVKEKTHGKITEIINNPEFMAALVNAVYFKGAWRSQFDKEATKKGIFTSRGGSKTEIDFMHRTGYMTVGDKNGVTILELPYSVGDGENPVHMSMYLLMNADKVENPYKTLQETELSSEYVRLSLPKFKTEFSIGLVPALQALGIKTAFSDQADFENMLGIPDMQILDVLHKTYIDVNEEGTEAAAVTAIMMEATSVMQQPQPREITFDKPFTYIIMDKTNQEILFMGEFAYAEA